MKPKNVLTLDNEFLLYCQINNISDPNKLAIETFNRGFSLLKYGETPNGTSVVKEIKVEVPVEVIVEKEIIKEVIKEVPIEKVIEKEVIVEKEIKVPYEVIKEIIKEVPVEIIKEIRVEVPIEVVKEVEGETKTVIKEIIKEVPIQIIKEVVKEVPIEKIVTICDTKEIDRLTEENKILKENLEKITSSLDKLNKGSIMKNSDLNSLYDE